MKTIEELAAKIQEISEQRDHLVDLRISDKGGYWQVEMNAIGRKYIVAGDTLEDTLKDLFSLAV